MQSPIAQQIELPPEARRRIVDTSKSNSICKIESNRISRVDDESNFISPEPAHLNNRKARECYEKQSITHFHDRCDSSRQGFAHRTLTTRSRCEGTSDNQLPTTKMKPNHLLPCRVASDSNRTTVNRIISAILLTLTTLLLIDCNLVSADTAATSDNSPRQQQLPTVIVRGFLVSSLFD